MASEFNKILALLADRKRLDDKDALDAIARSVMHLGTMSINKNPEKVRYLLTELGYWLRAQGFPERINY